jgi:hypothetical protein
MVKKSKREKVVNGSGPIGFVFFLAFIGAAVYFVQQSSGFWGFVLAILKACVWPAFLIHKAFELLAI